MRCVSLLLVLACTVPASAQDLTVERIMRDPDTWIGAWPKNPRWSESGDTLYFDWNPSGRFASDSLFSIPRSGGEPVQVPAEKRRRLGPVFNGWHHGEGVYDGSFRRKVYEDGGDIYVYDRASNTGKRLTHTRERERDPRLVQDGIVYRSGNNLFVVRTDGARRQLTDLRPGTKPSESARDTLLYEQQLELFETISTRKKRREEGERENERLEDSRAWPPVYYFGSKELDQLSVDRHLRFAAFVLDPPEDEKRTLVPAYVTESGHVETATARPKVGLDYKSRELYVQDLARDTTYRIDLPVDSSRSHYIYGPHWGEWYGVIEARTYDNKDRWIIRLDPETGAASTLDHQHDEAWIQAPGISSQGGRSSMGWLPDGRTFFFQSEKTGRSHIYTADVESGVVTQVTRGDFDVYDPMVSRDGRTWFFSSNEASPFERHFYRMPIEGGERMPLSESIDEAALNPDEETLAVLRSEVNHPPEIYLDGERITHSPTEEWLSYAWREPATITFEAGDGVEVPAHIFEPENPNGAAVLFVHGAGYLQNVHRRWSGNYYREYMFHNLLADEGYIVMNVDFRGSAGYGRDWRTSVYRHMGGRDLQDYVDASRFLRVEYDIDPERVFIYGGSYGGFITLMALFTEPEHFGGGAALRAVTDWAHYHHSYTANILNTPAEDSLAFRQSSPIFFAQGLDDPLLIAHGMMDDNVQFQDVVRLAQRLIELGKEDWELAVYPLEKHAFVESESWADEYRRILKYIRRSVGR